MLDHREAFLRAIFDAPDDDTPRLVYADWLDEHGDPDRAARIRTAPDRGFPPCDAIELDAGLLADPAEFRRVAAVERPEWFGATRLRVTGGLIAGAAQVETLLTAPATARVTALDLSGIGVEAPVRDVVVEAGGYRLIDVEERPVITVLGVEALANHRAARRLTELLLNNNQLDNDAARLLVRSPYLIRLTRLEFGGNRLRGGTWAELLKRFGEDVMA